MIAEENWGAFRFVHSALAVEVQAEATVCHLHAAMQSIATFQTGPLDSVLSLPRLVIALDAISNSSLFSLCLYF